MVPSGHEGWTREPWLTVAHSPEANEEFQGRWVLTEPTVRDPPQVTRGVWWVTAAGERGQDPNATYQWDPGI